MLYSLLLMSDVNYKFLALNQLFFQLLLWRDYSSKCILHRFSMVSTLSSSKLYQLGQISALEISLLSTYYSVVNYLGIFKHQNNQLKGQVHKQQKPNKRVISPKFSFYKSPLNNKPQLIKSIFLHVASHPSWASSWVWIEYLGETKVGHRKQPPYW